MPGAWKGTGASLLVVRRGVAELELNGRIDVAGYVLGDWFGIVFVLGFKGLRQFCVFES